MTVLGMLVNPIAGMGGRVALHGTDGDLLETAIAEGAEPTAPARMSRALHRLHALKPDLDVLTVSGSMGADLVEADWRVDVLGRQDDWFADRTTAASTRAAAAGMAAAGVDLILFGGGDGTARDIVEVVGDQFPILGVPCGVKMHSGVFATGPETAGAAAARFLARTVLSGPRPDGDLATAEVVDVVDGVQRLFGMATVPAVPGVLQGSKSGGASGSPADNALLGRAIAGEMRADRLYLLGPGTTVGAVNTALGIPASLNGVDVVLNGALLGADVSEQTLLAMLRTHPAATLILGVVGGQGFLFGRGNQQLSPAVLTAVGPENIEIVASVGKISALDPPVLRVDLDDQHLRTQLSGFRRVRTSARRSTVLRVAG